jgi:hypothetical protein
MGTRTREVALVLCFLVLAAGLAAVSEGLVPPVFGVSVIGLSANGPTSTQSGGSLFVRVINSSITLSPAVYGMTTFAVANASFTVLPSRIAPPAHGVFKTNSSGELEMKEAPGSYLVSFTSLPVNVSEVIKVSPNETTSVQVSLTSGTYAGVSLDLPSNRSGTVPAWSRVTAAIGSRVVLVGSEQAYLDLYYKTDLPALHAVRTPVLVTNSTLRTTGATSDEWIAFQPEDSIPLSGLVSMEFSVYGVQTSVTIGGGPPNG